MKCKVSLALVLLVLVASPLLAWRAGGDQDVRTAEYEAFVKQAIADSQKATEPGAQRYPLLAVSDLCVPSGGNSAKVSEALVAEYKAQCAKVWPEGEGDIKAFDAWVKQCEPKFTYQLYIRPFGICDDTLGNYNLAEFGKNCVEGATKHPAAVVVACEYAAKAIPPEAHQKYHFQGENGSAAGRIQRQMAEIYGGPETMRLCAKGLVPDAFEGAKQQLANWGEENDPGILKMHARFLEEDYINFIRWADPENADLKALQDKADAVRAKAKAIYEAEVKGNRVPKDLYGGDDKDALKAKMKQEFKLQEGATIIKVVIPGTNWYEKANIWTGINAIDVGWYKLIEAAVVVKAADGTFWVHPVTYGRRWTGTGNDYGELKVFGWADQYEVLAANLNK
ncbi:MAG: hypothetical protein ABFE08_23830 [Armatimonadia bacterium]